MKAAYLIASLILGAFFSVKSAQAAPPDLLQSKWYGSNAPPLWVSAASAIDRKSVLDWNSLGWDESLLLRQNVEQQQKSLADKDPGGVEVADLAIHALPVAECEASFLSSEEDGDIGSLAELARRSRTIFSGVIQESTPGFFSGLPGTLLTVRVSEALVGSSELVGASVYVEHSVAHFAIGPYRFCHGEKEFQPKVGDAIVVFDTLGPMDREGLLFSPIRSQILFQSPTRGLFVSERMRRDSTVAKKTDLREILSSVRAILAQRPEK